jgi:phosphatidylserine/phosphatidylglycerophosphate/cardiolipin synthase-like enzyme
MILHRFSVIFAISLAVCISSNAADKIKASLVPKVPSAAEVTAPLSPAQSCSNVQRAVGNGDFTPLDDPNLQVAQTPNDNPPAGHCHQAVIDAVNSAKSSVQMTMYHLTDQTVVQSLLDAAKRVDPSTGKPIQVQVLLDPSCPNLSTLIATLKKGGVQASASTPCFNMTHQKSFLVDAGTANPISAFGAMNMTGEDQLSKTGSIAPPSQKDICEATRDFDVVTHDKDIASDLKNLFDLDYKTALLDPPLKAGDKCPEPGDSPDYPALKSKSLVLSPVNSEAKLVSLIQSSWSPTPPAGTLRTVQCTAENWGDEAIEQALLTAADNGVQVQIIAPQCDENDNPQFDFGEETTLPMLIGHKNISVAAMPYPPSNGTSSDSATCQANPAAEGCYHPYMHSKMCRVNDSVTYVGSVNFSNNSTQHNRELGVIFKDSSTSKSVLEDGFKKDFAAATQVTSNPVPDSILQCPGSSSDAKAKSSSASNSAGSSSRK